jgi:hypothetical protein
MSEQDDSTNVRRLGRKDRKRRLDTRGPLFPPEPPAPPPPPAVEEPPEPPVIEEKPVPAAGRFPPLDFATDEDSAEPAPAPVKGRSTCLPNAVAALFLLATVVIIAIYGVITLNPYTALNPFPPFTPLPEIITATFLPPSATPLPTAGPTPTFTPIPLGVFGAQSGGFSFALTSSQPVYIANANNQGCNWSSIAGTVTDANGAALDGYGVHVTGEGVDAVVFSGAALTFGSGGFELFLNGAPHDNTYSVQLLSPQGTVVSDVYKVATKSTCDQNVAIVTFKEIGS